jgi:hypothetical protein
MEFTPDKFKPKNDRFVKSRDGNTKFLYITCTMCNRPVMIYQKDGKGGLIRCYADRIVWPESLIDNKTDSIVCAGCNATLGNSMIYEPEKRLAYRLVPGKLHIYRSLKQAQNRTRT